MLETAEVRLSRCCLLLFLCLGLAVNWGGMHKSMVFVIVVRWKTTCLSSCSHSRSVCQLEGFVAFFVFSSGLADW